VDRVDYLTQAGQLAKLRDEARQWQAIETARIYAAYVELAQLPSFDIVLTSWLQRTVLAPIVTPQDMGRHDFVLSVLTDLRNAMDGARLPGGPQWSG
jgi:hypothetical protein